MVKFRFQDLKIWQLAIRIADELFDLADELEKRKLYRFAEQLRGAGTDQPPQAEPVGLNFPLKDSNQKKISNLAYPLRP